MNILFDNKNSGDYELAHKYTCTVGSGERIMIEIWKGRRLFRIIKIRSKYMDRPDKN